MELKPGMKCARCGSRKIRHVYVSHVECDACGEHGPSMTCKKPSYAPDERDKRIAELETLYGMANAKYDEYYFLNAIKQKRIAELESELKELKTAFMAYEPISSASQLRIAELEAALQKALHVGEKYAKIGDNRIDALKQKSSILEEELRNTKDLHAVIELMVNEARSKDARIFELESEMDEQCRLHGMGSEREARQLSRIAEREAMLLDVSVRLKDYVENMGGDDPVGVIKACWNDIDRLLAVGE